jgi:hypothetical protein
MTFAASETLTVGPPVVTAEAPSAALTFGSLAFDSLPGVADPLDGVAGALLGGTRAADGGTDPTDAVAGALLDEVDGADGD